MMNRETYQKQAMLRIDGERRHSERCYVVTNGEAWHACMHCCTAHNYKWTSQTYRVGGRARVQRIPWFQSAPSAGQRTPNSPNHVAIVNSTTTCPNLPENCQEPSRSRIGFRVYRFFASSCTVSLQDVEDAVLFY